MKGMTPFPLRLPRTLALGSRPRPGPDLARVLAALAAQELSACQKFIFLNVLCRRPLTPGRPARCVSALRVRVGQVLPAAVGAERCRCLRVCGHCGMVDEAGARPGI